MTVEEIRFAGAELAERSRKAQGLSPKITDPAVLRRLAALFGPSVTPTGVMKPRGKAP